jgi:hypothetical protein
LSIEAGDPVVEENEIGGAFRGRCFRKSGGKRAEPSQYSRAIWVQEHHSVSVFSSMQTSAANFAAELAPKDAARSRPAS